MNGITQHTHILASVTWHTKWYSMEIENHMVCLYKMLQHYRLHPRVEMSASTQNQHGSIFCTLTLYALLQTKCDEVWLSLSPGNEIRLCYLQHIKDIDQAWNSTLTYWSRDKMDAILQTTLSSAFSGNEMFEFRLKFYWWLFLRVQLTIFQHWFR